MNTYGPLPIWSSGPICLSPGVSAKRLGMMNGTFEDGLPSESSTSPYGSFRIILKVFASTASHLSMNDASLIPIASRVAQRLIEAMQSSEVTGLLSWNSSPSRSVNVHVFLSGLTEYFPASAA